MTIRAGTPTSSSRIDAACTHADPLYVDVPISELIPHAGGVVLLDRITAWDENTLTALYTIKPGGVFNQADDSLPNWVGLEIMAQAVAAWAGCHARARGEPVRLGFLLSARHYRCECETFEPGLTLQISIRQSLRDDAGMAVFECALAPANTDARLRIDLAQARLAVYAPADPAKLLHEGPA